MRSRLPKTCRNMLLRSSRAWCEMNSFQRRKPNCESEDDRTLHRFTARTADGSRCKGGGCASGGTAKHPVTVCRSAARGHQNPLPQQKKKAAVPISSACSGSDRLIWCLSRPARSRLCRVSSTASSKKEANSSSWTTRRPELGARASSQRAGESIRARYAMQIDLYRRALEAATGKHVKEAYLYLTNLGETIEM